MSKILSLFQHPYHVLSSEEPSETDEKMRPAALCSYVIVAYLLLTACAACIVGVLLGRYSTQYGNYGLPQHCGDATERWYLNQSFVGAPTPETEAAWQYIIPEGRGFVTHPKLAPGNKALSVFHQIHCLHALRISYFTSLHDIEKSRNTSYSDPYLEGTKARSTTEHIEHCFEYLRQALMCAADTNLEDVNPQTHETNGWGVTRKCQDYWRVFRWAEKWKNNHDHSILSAEVDAGIVAHRDRST